MNRKFQIAEQVVSRPGQVINFNVELEKGWDQVKEITIFNSEDPKTNQNLKLTDPLEIDGQEVYCRRFFTAFLHPLCNSPIYKRCRIKSLDGKLRTAMQDQNSEINEPYSVYIQLTLAKSEC